MTLSDLRRINPSDIIYSTGRNLGMDADTIPYYVLFLPQRTPAQIDPKESGGCTHLQER
jgi:hypothetical protein